MTDSWTLAVARDELTKTTLVDGPVPDISDGEALLRVDRVGMTANNVTYAVLGYAMRYWQFFPAAARGLGEEWGLVPLWGFAEVVASKTPGVEPGQRVYGYLPPAGHLVVRPARVDATGFRDASEHRAELPSPYQAYRLTSGDLAYRADQEDLLVLFRPLFFTSYMLADQVLDNDSFGAETVVLSSASSKTAYAAAFELHGKVPHLVGLTSPGNKEFTASLGCYDEVLGYDEVASLPRKKTAYLDLSGAADLRATLKDHFGDALVRDVAVGLTHQSPNAKAADQVFFAPDQMRKRTEDWGREGLDRRFGEAWHRFSEKLDGWVDVQVGHGAAGLESAWLEVLSGRTAPRTGHVIQL